jgi:hypothetical protein
MKYPPPSIGDAVISVANTKKIAIASDLNEIQISASQNENGSQLETLNQYNKRTVIITIILVAIAIGVWLFTTYWPSR